MKPTKIFDKDMPKIIALFISLFISLQLISANAYAIVNLDSLHFNKQNTGSSGELSLGFSGSRGNTNKSQIHVDGHYKFTTKQYQNIALANYQRGESNDTLNTNKRFIHLRHIHNSSQSRLSWELYFQSESNQFTRLSVRNLLGSGIRITINKNAATRHFIGLGGFYSKETLINNGGSKGNSDNVTRANIYSLTKLSISDTATLFNTLYYQPNIESASDVRAFNVTTLKIKILKQLSLKMSFQVTRDSRPPENVHKTDTNYSTSFVYSF